MSANYDEVAFVEEVTPKDEQETNELSEDHFIVYEEEIVKQEIHDLNMEVLEETEYETEWIDDGKIVEIGPDTDVEKYVKIKSQPSRRSPLQLDSADDERIRKTANMFCDLCQEPFDSLREAKAHYKSAHAIEGYITCCGRKFRQRCRLVEHVNTHFNFTYSCEICEKTFDSKSYLAKHQALHDQNKQFVSSTFWSKSQVSNFFSAF